MENNTNADLLGNLKDTKPVDDIQQQSQEYDNKIHSDDWKDDYEAMLSQYNSGSVKDAQDLLSKYIKSKKI